jgi:hypothetical protein
VIPAAAGLVTLVCTFGGALVGLVIRKSLPRDHVSDDSRDTIKLGIALVATMTALVLGLVTASAKSSFDAVDSTVKQAAAQLLSLAQGVEHLAAQTRRLAPQTEEQRRLQSLAVELEESLLGARWMVFGSLGSGIPLPFLVILLFWLAIAFASFGMLAPPNATVVSILFVCALSVSAAVFLILEMDGPFEGFLIVSSEPLKYALTHLNR